MTALLESVHLELILVATTSAPIEGPAPEDVKAGWTAFAVFLLLVAAMVVLGISLTKQLRKAQAAKDAGVYGDRPASGSSDRAEGE